MSSVLLSVMALALALAAAGLYVWQSAKWQEQRQQATAGLDQLMTLELGMPSVSNQSRQARQRQQALFAGGKNVWASQLLLRAGLADRPRTLVFACLPSLLMAASGALLQGLVLALVLGAFGALVVMAWLKWRISRQRMVLSHAIPGYLDSVVRMMTVGHSVQSAFQNGITAPDTPLGNAMAHASRLQASGLDPDQALQTVGELYDSTELILLASILRMGMRFGGRADLIVGRVAVFIRDREQAQQELMAQSAETRLSAWILGLLPVGLALYIIAMNPKYIGRMWADPTGQNLLIGALVLQLLGAAVLYKLAKSLED